MGRAATRQGEALLTWALWLLVLVVIVITYARLDPADLYHVSGEGLAAGLSRALVVANFPLSLVAIALVLVAVDVLPRRAWLVGGPVRREDLRGSGRTLPADAPAPPERGRDVFRPYDL